MQQQQEYHTIKQENIPLVNNNVQVKYIQDKNALWKAFFAGVLCSFTIVGLAAFGTHASGGTMLSNSETAKIISSNQVPNLSMVTARCGSTGYGQQTYMQPLPVFSRDVAWVGHLRPDADSVASSIGAAYLFDGIPMIPGDINRETAFLLDYFDITKPPHIQDAYRSKQPFGLVDHNAQSQRDHLLNATHIVAIFDHHALSNEPTIVPQPIYVEVRPWGSCSAVIATKFLEHGIHLAPGIAGMLMGGIISDTINLKGPTTTHWDRQALHWLSTLVLWNHEDGHYMQGGCFEPDVLKSHVNAFARRQFMAKSNLTGWAMEDILMVDYKDFAFRSNSSRRVNIGWATIETVQPFYSEYLGKEKMAELLDRAMPAIAKQQAVDILYVSIVDILDDMSVVACFTKPSCQLIAHAYRLPSVDPEFSRGVLPTTPMISRKKEFLPAIRKSLLKTNFFD